MTNKRAAIYSRVSTDMQRDNYSVPTQVAECAQYIEKRGYALVGSEFVDMDTGRTCKPGPNAITAFVDDLSSRELNRPGLDAALSYLETVGFDVLVIHALDRLARDPYIRQTLEREVNARGAKVEFVLGSYEDSPEGEVRKDLDATFGKWENAKRVERCNRGKRKKAESGKFVVGVIPFGYRDDKDAPSGLVIHPQEAEAVQKIFNLYLMGFSIYQLCEEMNQTEIKPYYGGRWVKSTMIRLLENTAYVGHIFYNKHKRNGKLLEKRDKSEWIRIEVPPIVSQEVFDAVQERKETNREIVRRQPKRSYMLTGRIRCEECNYAYVTQTKNAGKDRRKEDGGTYRHRIKQNHCMNRSISARRMDAIVWEKVLQILLEPDMLKKGYYDSLERQQADYERQKLLLEEMRRSLVKFEQRKQNLTRAYTDPDIQMTKTEYLSQRGEIEKEVESLVTRIEDTEQSLKNVPTPAEFETLEAFAREIRERLQNPDWEPSLENKKRVMDLLHVQVWLRKDGTGKIEGWFSDESGGLSNITC